MSGVLLRDTDFLLRNCIWDEGGVVVSDWVTVKLWFCPWWVERCIWQGQMFIYFLTDCLCEWLPLVVAVDIINHNNWIELIQLWKFNWLSPPGCGDSWWWRLINSNWKIQLTLWIAPLAPWWVERDQSIKNIVIFQNDYILKKGAARPWIEKI